MVEAVKHRVEHGFEDLAELGHPGAEPPGLAFLLRPAPVRARHPGSAWLGMAGRLALTALIAAVAIWLALTEADRGAELLSARPITPLRGSG